MDVTATRSELLAINARLALARQGRDLLREKRDQLMEEFRSLSDVVLAGTATLASAARRARRTLAVAEAEVGPEVVASAALSSRSQIPLTSRPTTIMGVRIADITYEPIGRPRAERGYSLAGSDVRIDDAAAAFESELEALVELAIGERRLRRLVDEIAKTTRRVNALEFIVVPGLEAQAAAIRRILDERERQDRFRLKRVKAQKGRRLEQVA